MAHSRPASKSNQKRASKRPGLSKETVRETGLERQPPTLPSQARPPACLPSVYTVGKQHQRVCLPVWSLCLHGRFTLKKKKKESKI